MLSLILLTAGVPRDQTVECRLVESHVRLKPFQASSNSAVGQFSFVSGDTPITKVLRHDESGLDVTVGVDLFKISENDPTRIRIAILPGSKTNDIFGSGAESSEAVSIFDKHWRALWVNRTVAKEDLLYTFTLSCGRPLKNRSR
jgi:hypothetical protein